ncbi:SDR family NAD(P)-dependent oxidoreductase [Nafulsella turpanensis]|uniref:SDR family NAD(P)-dependent oxidoreductase n=1 Tax=Nafulsella turpanensis TaxID=1265690 RepID=UPI00034A2105|nr:SDR family NAD(P)-dependent oxidoreductase [Nafulsella turpanensis]
MNQKKIIWLAGLAAAIGVRKIWHRKREKQFPFFRKVVFITGASRGLGLILARQLAKQNARLAICARSEIELQRAKNQLQQEYAAEVLCIPCDVADQKQVEQVIDQVVAHYGKLDVLINNAGEIIVSPLQNNTLNDFDQLMKVHFYGPLFAMQAVVPYMQQQGEGRIVNISSIGGRLSVPHLLPYSASKFALSGLSEGIHSALKKENIHVTTVYPGLMRTRSPRNVLVKGQYEKEYQWFKICDSVPGMSVNAERAAAKILRACQRAEASITISLPAKLAGALQGLFPGFTARLNTIVNNLMPEATESNKSIRGYETGYEQKESWLTQLTDKSARENLNVLGHPPRQE